MSKPSPARDRTTNWASYTFSLRKRGSLLIWLDKDMTWLAPGVERLFCASRLTAELSRVPDRTIPQPS
jgi:hypothetical protein